MSKSYLIRNVFKIFIYMNVYVYMNIYVYTYLQCL